MPSDLSNCRCMSRDSIKYLSTDQQGYDLLQAQLEQQLTKEKLTHLRLMLEQAKEHEEKAKAEFAKNKTQKNSDKWTEAKKTLDSIEQQVLAVSSQQQLQTTVVLPGGDGGTLASAEASPTSIAVAADLGDSIFTAAVTPSPAKSWLRSLGSTASSQLPASGCSSLTSAAAGSVIHKKDSRVARRSNSVVSFNSASASLFANSLAEVPSRRVATRVASQNVCMASSADVADCSVVLLPPPVVIVPSAERGVLSVITDNGDEGMLRSSSDVQVNMYTLSATAAKPPLPPPSPQSILAVSHSQANIISMEDDDFPGEMQAAAKDHGPFNDLELLKKRIAHCAVFLSYLVSNGDPSALLLHLVTDSYMQGNLRDMKKWAYEIHSMFTVKDAPLQVKIDSTSVLIIDSVIEKKSDKEDMMRTLFVQARNCCLPELMSDLADFRNKRDLGLGNLFGDSDLHNNMDRASELRVAEIHLRRLCEQFRADSSPRSECMGYTLVALMREWGILKAAAGSMAAAVGTALGGGGGAALERAPSLLMKDRSTLKDILSGKMSKTKKEIFKGHTFSPQTYHVTTYCDVCNVVVWGVGLQGHQCQACEINVHRDCMPQVGACQKKRRPRTTAPHESGMKKKHSLVVTASLSLAPQTSQLSASGSDKDDTGEMSPIKPVKKDDDSIIEFPSHSVDHLVKRFECSSSTTSSFSSATLSPLVQAKARASPDIQAQASHHVRAKSTAGLIDLASVVATASSTTSSGSRPLTRERAGSFSDKTSTKTLGLTEAKDPRRSRSDVDQEQRAVLESLGGMYNVQQFKSSASSLSRSDSDSDVMMPPLTLASPAASLLANHRMSVIGVPLQSAQQQQRDSDLEVEMEMPTIDTFIPKEQLRKLKPKEKKRQEIINELLYTERSHVRNLKILDKLFHVPMAAEPSISSELVRLLFSNISDVVKLHCSMNNAMRQRQKENVVVQSIADILLDRFEGKAGEQMKEVCSEFCRNHTLALDTLKARRRKDSKLQEIIHAAESSSQCRRLQLHDLMIAEVQRLTKYPLLIRSLLKHTHADVGNDEAASERSGLEAALCCSEGVLEHVNSAVKECEDRQTLIALQKRLDTSPIEKSTNPLVIDYKSLDLTKHRLICEGTMTWRLPNRKLLGVHAVLLESVLVLLQTHDDGRLLLACQSTGGTKDDAKFTHSPVVRLNSLLTRLVATDKKAFFIISTELGAQIYELVTGTAEERKRWFKHITDAADSQRKLLGKPSSSVQAIGGNLSDSDLVGRVGEASSVSEVAAGNQSDHDDLVASFDKEDKEELQVSQERLNCGDDTVDFPAAATSAAFLPLEQEQAAAIAQQLREKDDIIKKAMGEKKQLIAAALKLPNIECCGAANVNKEMEHNPKALVLSAMSDMLQLTSLMSAAMQRLTESNAAHNEQLSARVANLNHNLNSLLDIIVERDVEEEGLREQLRRAHQRLSLETDAAIVGSRMHPVGGAVRAGTPLSDADGSRPVSPSPSSSSTSSDATQSATESSTMQEGCNDSVVLPLECQGHCEGGKQEGSPEPSFSLANLKTQLPVDQFASSDETYKMLQLDDVLPDEVEVTLQSTHVCSDGFPCLDAKQPPAAADVAVIEGEHDIVTKSECLVESFDDASRTSQSVVTITLHACGEDDAVTSNCVNTVHDYSDSEV